MAAQTILTKTTTKGEAKVSVLTGDQFREPSIQLTLAGNYIGSWSIHNATVAALAKPIGPNTHALAGRLALTAAEAEIIEAAKIAARTEYEALPVFSAKRLRSERESLCCSLAASLDDLSAHRECCYQEDCGFHGMEPFDAAIKTASEKLAAFDAAHPEIVGIIEREKAERAERNAWN